MTNLFQFTDAPELDDIWETQLNVDVLIHTRPILIAQRDRFALNYGSSYAEFELQNAVYMGLKRYAYMYFPDIQEKIYDYIETFYNEAVTDAIQTYTVLRIRGDFTADIDARAQELLHHTLQTPELIAQFTDQLLLKLHTLDPMERLHEIYRLRAQLIAQDIPFSTQAPQILDDYFQKHCPILALRAQLQIPPAASPTFDFSERVPLCKALFTDIIHGLIHRIETNHDFLDTILAQWAIPQLHERFHEVDREIDSFQINGQNIDRLILITRMKARPEWLQLAEQLGTPVPLPLVTPPDDAHAP